MAFRRHLAKNLFLLPDDFDELAYIKDRTIEAQYDESQLGLVIAPTIGCNFSCHYCFEQRTSGELSEAPKKRSPTSFVKTSSEGTDFAVQWFGGEPLLSLSLMERLSAAFLRLSAKHAVRYAATVITNGSMYWEKSPTATCSVRRMG